MGILVRFNGCLRGWTTAERNKMTNREKAIEDVAKEIGVGVDAVKQRLDNSWSIGGLGYVTAQRELVLDLRDALLEMEEIVAACYLVLRRHGLVNEVEAKLARAGIEPGFGSRTKLALERGK